MIADPTTNAIGTTTSNSATTFHTYLTPSRRARVEDRRAVRDANGARRADDELHVRVQLLDRLLLDEQRRQRPLPQAIGLRLALGTRDVGGRLALRVGDPLIRLGPGDLHLRPLPRRLLFGLHRLFDRLRERIGEVDVLERDREHLDPESLDLSRKEPLDLLADVLAVPGELDRLVLRRHFLRDLEDSRIEQTLDVPASRLPVQLDRAIALQLVAHLYFEEDWLRVGGDGGAGTLLAPVVHDVRLQLVLDGHLLQILPGCGRHESRVGGTDDGTELLDQPYVPVVHRVEAEQGGDSHPQQYRDDDPAHPVHPSGPGRRHHDRQHGAHQDDGCDRRQNDPAHYSSLVGLLRRRFTLRASSIAGGAAEGSPSGDH